MWTLLYKGESVPILNPLRSQLCYLFLLEVGGNQSTSIIKSDVSMFAYDPQLDSFILGKHTFGRNGSLKVGFFPLFLLAFHCLHDVEASSTRSLFFGEVKIGTRCIF